MLLSLSVAAWCCFLSFAWALRGHFRLEGRMPPGMRCLSILSVVTFVGLVVRLRVDAPDIAASLSATVLFVASGALFWWTVRTTRTDRLLVAYSASAPVFLHITGPYRVIRHPFYSSYILFWIGTAIAAGPALWLPCLILCAWYIRIAYAEESCLAASRQVADYAQYRDRTGMLAPRLAVRVGGRMPTRTVRRTLLHQNA